MKPFAGEIEKWEIHKLSKISGAVFTGTVSGKSHKFETGWHMRSSLIKRIQKRDGYFEVETANSIYHLHGPRGDNVFTLRGDVALTIFY